MPKPFVLIISGPEGHLSIAKSIFETIKDKYLSELIEIKEPFIHFYKPIYRLFPWAFKIPFLFSQLPGFLSITRSLNDRRYKAKLTQLISEKKPDVVISTYFMFNPTLGRICRQNKILFINPLTDPWSIHPMLVEDGAINLVFDEQAEKIALRHQPRATFTTTGWFVRDDYEQNYHSSQIRQQLKLKKDVFTILIVSGSEGNMTVEKILPSLFTTNKEVQIVVACGNNRIMYKTISQLKKILTRNSKTILHVLPFEPKLYLYMQAADLIVGKAGPNTIFESIATKTPFFAITHISGQESGNLDIIKHYNLGLVEENAKKASKLLRKIIEEPVLLTNFMSPIEKMANYNHLSKKKLISIIDNNLNKSN